MVPTAVTRTSTPATNRWKMTGAARIASSRPSVSPSTGRVSCASSVPWSGLWMARGCAPEEGPGAGRVVGHQRRRHGEAGGAGPEELERLPLGRLHRRRIVHQPDAGAAPEGREGRLVLGPGEVSVGRAEAWNEAEGREPAPPDGAHGPGVDAPERRGLAVARRRAAPSPRPRAPAATRAAGLAATGAATLASGPGADQPPAGRIVPHGDAPARREVGEVDHLQPGAAPGERAADGREVVVTWVGDRQDHRAAPPASSAPRPATQPRSAWSTATSAGVRPPDW